MNYCTFFNNSWFKYTHKLCIHANHKCFLKFLRFLLSFSVFVWFCCKRISLLWIFFYLSFSNFLSLQSILLLLISFLELLKKCFSKRGFKRKPQTRQHIQKMQFHKKSVPTNLLDISEKGERERENVLTECEPLGFPQNGQKKVKIGVFCTIPFFPCVRFWCHNTIW